MAEEWHLDKKVPISLIGAILFQTFVFGMWASNLNDRIAAIEKDRAERIAAAGLEFTKLELARETNDKIVIQLGDKVDSILNIVRRNEDRNTRKDNPNQGGP